MVNRKRKLCVPFTCWCLNLTHLLIQTRPHPHADKHIGLPVLTFTQINIYIVNTLTHTYITHTLYTHIYTATTHALTHTISMHTHAYTYIQHAHARTYTHIQHSHTHTFSMHTHSQTHTYTVHSQIYTNEQFKEFVSRLIYTFRICLLCFTF